MFESEVLKRVPDNIKIGIVDWDENKQESNYVKRWLRDYNIQYYYSDNTSCVQHLSEARNLKVVVLHFYPSCDANDGKIFCKLKHLHSLCIYLSFKAL